MSGATAAQPGTANAVAAITRRALNFSITDLVFVPGSMVQVQANAARRDGDSGIALHTSVEDIQARHRGFAARLRPMDFSEGFA